MFKKLDIPDIPKPSETTVQPQPQMNKPKTIFDFMNENKITFQQLQSELTKYGFDTRDKNILTDLVFNKLDIFTVKLKYNVQAREVPLLKEKVSNMIINSCNESDRVNGTEFKVTNDKVNEFIRQFIPF